MTLAAADRRDHDAPAHAVRARPLARPVGADWPATCVDRESIFARLTSAPFAPRDLGPYKRGVGLLLEWLNEKPGRTWQERWHASGIEAAGSSWRDILADWLREQGYPSSGAREWFVRALTLAVCADILRPSLTWLVTANFRRGSLVNALAQFRDSTGFTQLRALCAADPGVNASARTRTAYRGALILAAKGGTLADITTGM